MPKSHLRLAVSNPPKEEHVEDADDWGTTAEDLLQFLGQGVETQARAARSKLRNGPLEADARAFAEECDMPFELFVTAAGVCIARAAHGDNYTSIVASNLAYELKRANHALFHTKLEAMLAFYNKQSGP